MKKKTTANSISNPSSHPNQSKIRLIDIAQLAGVSVASVSRVIRGAPNIDAEIRNRIENAMAELNIGRDYFNRNKATDSNPTQSVLVCVHDILDTFYTSVIKGVEDIADSHKFDIILVNINNNDIIFQNKLKYHLQNKNIQGVLYAPARVSLPTIDLMTKEKMPFVLVENSTDHPQVCYIASDIYSCAYDSAKYLISLGHRRILYIAGANRFSSEQEKYSGYCDALSDSGIMIEPELRIDGDSDLQKVNASIESILDQEIEFSAILCANDLMAFAAKQTLNNRGLSVPDDISLMGFDDLSVSSTISLTTSSRPAYEIGRNAMFMLIDLINKRITPPKNILLNPTMKIRNSCRRNNKYFEDTARSIAGSRIIRIGYTPPTDSEFYDIIKHGAYTMMKELSDRFGVKFEFEIAAPAEHHAVSSQIAIIENWIAKKFDAILVCSAGDINTMNKVFQKAIDNETAIYMFNMPAEMWDESKLKAVSVIGYNNHYQSGYLVGQYIAKKLNGHGKMLLIWGLPGHWSTARKEGFLEAIKPYPGLQIVGEQRGDYEFEKGKQVAFELLQQHPDIDLIYGENEEMAHGAVEAIENLRLPFWNGHKGIITIGADGLKSGYNSIRAGKLTATVNVGPVDQGREFIMAVFMHEALGYSVDKIINVPTTVVDLSNVDTAAAYTDWALGTEYPG
jgi:ribose transport system substrate-binding protein